MTKKKSNKFISGAVVGTALGVAAGVVLAVLDEKKIKSGVNSAKREAAMIYKKAAPQLKQYKKLGEKEFDAVMKKAVHEFAKARKMSKKDSGAVLREVEKYWKEVKKHLPM